MRLIAVLAAGFVIAGNTGTQAQNSRPYDRELFRLSELIGSVHYLRALCGHKDGQLWRDRMQTLINAEGTSAIRRVVLTRRFNRGYTNYSRTYRDCTVAARTALDRALSESSGLADRLLDDGAGAGGTASADSGSGANP